MVFGVRRSGVGLILGKTRWLRQRAKTACRLPCETGAPMKPRRLHAESIAAKLP
jgi:hypothetical protein